MSVCISLYVSAPPVAMLGIAAHVYRVRKCANGTRAKEYHKCLTVNMSTWKGTERRATQWRQSEEVYVLFSGTYPKTLLIQAILFTGFTITTTNSRGDKNSHRKLFLKCEIVVNFIKKKANIHKQFSSWIRGTGEACNLSIIYILSVWLLPSFQNYSNIRLIDGTKISCLFTNLINRTLKALQEHRNYLNRHANFLNNIIVNSKIVKHLQH